MYKVIKLSMISAIALCATDVIELETINVNEKVNSIIVKDVSGEELKSADLAEALSKNNPSISMIRRSAIANDIVIRGQKRDNINVIIDGAKIYGGCPNRMDPPISHVLTNNIETVIVKEGPYDVENFGTLSGKVEIKTKEPKEEFEGEVNVNMGSFSYKKVSASASGGIDKVRFLISMSKEESGQYKDGDGNTLSQQVDNKASSVNNKYQDKYKDMDAYEKKTLLTKLYFDLTDNQALKFSYTANRSDNVMYPSTGMDALRDDSDIFDLSYTAKDLGDYSKELNLNYYNSKVEHPMSTLYRNAAVNTMMKEMINDMTSKISGLKIKNSLDINDAELLLGIDTSKRSWEGKYYKQTNVYLRDSITKAETKNNALFMTYDKNIGDVNVSTGVRYDDTKIDSSNTSMNDNQYNSFTGNIFTTYKTDKDTKYFMGFGKASRVPDARELYFVHSSGAVRGNDELNQTNNYEIDLGVEKFIGDFKIKTKIFYSILENYIYYSGTRNTFENVDAKVYGLAVNGFYYLNDNLYFDYGVAYQKGKKDALQGQSNTNMADIAPLKGNISVNYEEGKHKFNFTAIASDSWDDYDDENGEQKLSGFVVYNTKYNNQITKSLDMTIGLDNILDKTYAVSNTYNDLTLVSTGSESMLLNEPGRYGYINLRYKF